MSQRFKDVSSCSEIDVSNQSRKIEKFYKTNANPEASFAKAVIDSPTEEIGVIFKSV